MRIRSPLKWHGGKNYLATQIVSLFPPRCTNPEKPSPKDKGWLHYVEPYFGGGSVLLANDPVGISEVANDLNGELTNFWQVLQGQTSFHQFRRLSQALPFSEWEFKNSKINSVLEADGYGETVHRAVTFFIRCRQSLAGRMKEFTGVTRTRTRRGMNNEVSAWLSAVEGLPLVHARLKRVLIRNQPALKLIEKEDDTRTLFYVDPPYLHETRKTVNDYEHEMSVKQHEELLAALCLIKGRFLLSGYRSGLYDTTAKSQGWNRFDFEIDNKAAGGKKKRKMVESVWINYEAPRQQIQKARNDLWSRLDS
jgi:DNA adenine methylase